jgi:hypothetical protein
MAPMRYEPTDIFSMGAEKVVEMAVAVATIAISEHLVFKRPLVHEGTMGLALEPFELMRKEWRNESAGSQLSLLLI